MASQVIDYSVINKPRYDNKGSYFGLLHRKLPRHCTLFDIDSIKAEAKVDLFMDKQDSIFIEYRTDFTNNTCKFVAMFELKFKDSDSVRAAMNFKKGQAIWAQVAMCKQLGMRYFFVISNSGKSPFIFYEYDFINLSFNFVYEMICEENENEAINKAWEYLKLT